jgi:hypothetical protein
MTYILLPINVLLKIVNQITSYVLVKGYIIIGINLIKQPQMLTNNHIVEVKFKLYSYSKII